VHPVAKAGMARAIRHGLYHGNSDRLSSPYWGC
jgi:hypothetical protein